MARPQTTDDAALLTRLAEVFRRTGFSGASLERLAQEAGLRKASLYHRFPGGKQQMAEQVLDSSRDAFRAQVLAPLDAPGAPRARLDAALAGLDAFYAGGQRACLLNMLAPQGREDGPFAERIKGSLERTVAAFAALAAEAGHPPDAARRRAVRAVMMIQGSLVMARALGSHTPFRQMLDDLPQELLG
ncbi:TetR/AcrR family transcriptional regulator [Xanthobacter tagetidis]|jgi:AcrR family transcriptional regulator|uniref:TetR/AcrR family transcriptional regulator n=1 Tax=Xanthobacter tagetidis TaxID=60216 RepID=A0A3L7AMV9_9HYPH|nr:TetR/AcrR family transcriptional regulator [Xanthobacter tagetidis]MBB6308222.1 AcrR family transcriptional regulator [Xanthobacter tagetidis]RLP81836.1 TetR/AcrR family transcriptional regulator [Xanthobacter tagetidis]